MQKKLIALAMAIGAIAAMAAPSVASAAPVLTQPTGTIVAAGTPVVGTNVGEMKMTTALGNVTCTAATVKGTVLSSSTASGTKGEATEASFVGSGVSSECTSWTGGVTVTTNVTGGLPWCFETTSGDEGRVRGGKCSELSRGIKYILDFTSIGACEYNRSTAVATTFATDVSGQDTTISMTEQEWTKVAGSAFCPSTGKLDATFKLETTTGASMYASS
jgi:hypothetical protein